MGLVGRSLCDTTFPTQLGRWFPVQKDGATEIEDEIPDIRMLTADIALLKVSVLFVVVVVFGFSRVVIIQCSRIVGNLHTC